MKHKFLAVLLAILTAFCMAFSVAACGEKSDETGENPPITDPSGNQGTQGNQGSQGGTQKPDDGEQGGTQKPDEEEPETYTEGLSYIEMYGEDGTTVIGYSVGAGEAADKKEIVIPSKHNNLPVLSISRSIDDKAFWDKMEEENKGATEEGYFSLVQKCSFGVCINLEKITIPDSVTTIGEGAFQACSKLKSITIPNGVTEIGNGAFGACSALTEIMIPDSVTSIGSDAFMNCFALKAVHFENPNGWNVSGLEDSAKAAEYLISSHSMLKREG